MICRSDCSVANRIISRAMARGSTDSTGGSTTRAGHIPTRSTPPGAPRDTVMSIGIRGNSSAIIPSLNVALVCADGDWDDLDPGNADSKINQALSLLAQACEPSASIVSSSRPTPKWRPVVLSFQGPDTSESATPNPLRTIDLLSVCSWQQNRHGSGLLRRRRQRRGIRGGERKRVAREVRRPMKWACGTTPLSFRPAPYSRRGYAREGTAHGIHGATGSFEVGPLDPNAPGFEAKGILQSMTSRYPQFAETGEYFIKGGVDSPENMLAFADFDGTTPTHRFEPHAGDWREGDPSWRDGKGKNLIGALNYLASKEINSVYFLTMNVIGDGKDVWPWTQDTERSRFDCSKLDQWEIVSSIWIHLASCCT